MKYGWLMFVAGAILTWGAYVVTIDHGRNTLAGSRHGSKPAIPMPVAAMRAFLFIGIAYFVLGVLVPAVYLMTNRVDPAKFPNDPGFLTRGVVLSTLAGLLGAAGALCIVFAVGAARRANVSAGAVASLVFCFAPIVNVIISMVVEPPARRPSPLFFLGILMAAAGAGMVLYFKPEPKPHGAPTAQRTGDVAPGSAASAPATAASSDAAGGHS